MRRVLVGGASGHLGRFALRAFKEQGFQTRALTRSPSKLTDCGDVVVGDVTRPETLAGVCDGIDVVFSAVGQSLSLRPTNEKGTFRGIDYHGNRNLLAVARDAGVQKFIYVSLFGAELMGRLDYVAAHEDFVAELRAAGIAYTVVRPTGFFSTFGEMLEMARSGRAIVFGDGLKRTNPVHEADLAQVCVEAVTRPEREIPVGGPVVYTRAEIAELGFAALGINGKVTRLPVWLAGLAARLLYPFDRRMAALLEFGVAAMQVDGVAPRVGTRTLEQYFEEIAPRLAS